MRNRKPSPFILILIILFSLLAANLLIEPYWLEVKTLQIIDPDLPAAFNGTRILFASDIHHGPFFSLARVRKLVQKINALKPDLILLGGDYIYHSPVYIEPCFRELALLRAPLGVFGALGNHDHWEDPVLTRTAMRTAGIRLLDNHAFWLEKGGARIKLGGVGDYYEDSQALRPTTHDLKKRDFVVLVTHNPDYVTQIKTDKIDLIFAGHNHGGQVTLFGLWAPVIPSKYGQKFRTGDIQTNQFRLIISNGLGTTGLPIRFFARPQLIIAVLENC